MFSTITIMHSMGVITFKSTSRCVHSCQLANPDVTAHLPCAAKLMQAFRFGRRHENQFNWILLVAK